VAQPPTIKEDNQACLALVNNPEATGRTKHVDVAYHMARDYVARGEVAFYFLAGAEMPADGLTSHCRPLRLPPSATLWVLVPTYEGPTIRGVNATYEPAINPLAAWWSYCDRGGSTWPAGAGLGSQ